MKIYDFEFKALDRHLIYRKYIYPSEFKNLEKTIEEIKREKLYRPIICCMTVNPKGYKITCVEIDKIDFESVKYTGNNYNG